MEILLRKIDNPHAWDQAESTSVWPWLPQGDFAADLFGDLVTKRNKLSVYSVAEDQSNVRTIAGALTVTRGQFDRFEYVLFSESLLTDVGIGIDRSKGHTPDEEANEAHRDLTQISAQRLHNLARNIVRSRMSIGLVGQHELLTAIMEALKKGRFRKESVKEWDRFCEGANKLGISLPRNL